MLSSPDPPPWISVLGKIAQGQTGQKSLIDIGHGKEAHKRGYVKNEPHIRFQELNTPQNRQFGQYE